MRFFRVLIFSVISFSKVRNDLDLEEFHILDQVFLKIKTLVQNAACFPKLSLGWRNPYEGLHVPKKFICELNMNFANRKCGFISCSTINQPPPDPLGEGTQKIYPPSLRVSGFPFSPGAGKLWPLLTASKVFLRKFEVRQKLKIADTSLMHAHQCCSVCTLTLCFLLNFTSFKCHHKFT